MGLEGAFEASFGMEIHLIAELGVVRPINYENMLKSYHLNSLNQYNFCGSEKKEYSRDSNF